MLSIGYIGSGKLVQALIQGWQGNSEMQHFVYSKAQNPDLSQMQQIEFPASVLEVWQEADIMLLAESKETLKELAPQLAMAATVKPAVIVTSLTEDMTLNELHELLGSQLAMARAVPNLNVGVREGYTGMAFDNDLDEEVRGAIAMLFLELGRVDEYLESQLPTVSAIASLGPALVAKVIDALAHGAVESGLSADRAIAIAEQSLYGTAADFKTDQRSPKAYEQALSETNGAVAPALDDLEQSGFSEKVRQALISIAENNNFKK